VAKYGNAAEKPPEDLALLRGTEKYVEYDRMGRVVKGQVGAGRGGGASWLDLMSFSTAEGKQLSTSSPDPCCSCCIVCHACVS
jgi:hypothetical protein